MRMSIQLKSREIHPLEGHFCVFMSARQSRKLQWLDYNVYHNTGAKASNKGGSEKMDGVAREEKVIVSDILECLELNELKKMSQIEEIKEALSI